MGYQSPYYTPSPTAPQPSVHRTPWILIVSGVVVLVIVMAGCGTAIALFNKSANVTVTGGITSGPPSPSPAGSPSPIPSAPTGASTETNAGITIPKPAGWTTFDNTDGESITLVSPSSDGQVTVASGQSNPKQTAQQRKQAVDAFFANTSPDAKDCPGSQTKTITLNGVPGISWTVCLTLTPSRGQPFPAVASLFCGANGDGSVFYEVMLLTFANNLSAFATEAAPILQGIQWKLK